MRVVHMWGITHHTIVKYNWGEERGILSFILFTKLYLIILIILIIIIIITIIIVVVVVVVVVVVAVLAS